ncbi:SMI1/KNR4 family protein [Chitinophaga sp. S165]|uniref:SMI1/KNR4 family protein n=1 Tax=Chitinophaga sp. S165 TaxID=2135462 RepID=UPI000D711F34|nr:SMI1/KNR4 family protein [Chitinophaga sp. S165]PWV56823.1 SMI1/KNR4 family protein SUKH-1 [Chitinophaga sp. S165]
MTNRETLKNIIDAHLKICVENEFNQYPGEIESEMTDHTLVSEEDWGRWFPIDSTVTDGDIESFEKQLGYKLPDDYRTFLRYKHFYELHISASFCSHPVNTWLKHQHKMIFDGWPADELIEKGLIPFADWSDLRFTLL